MGLRMNRLLKSKLREYSYALNKMIDEGASDDDLRAKIESQMSVIFRIIGICLGVPPETFTWQYYDKAKEYNDVREVTPLQFYTQHVKPVFDISNKISLLPVFPRLPPLSRPNSLRLMFQGPPNVSLLSEMLFAPRPKRRLAEEDYKKFIISILCLCF